MFLHPGRLSLGEASFDRLGAQFELECPDVFASLDEAEAACADRAGFLFELEGGFTDAEGSVRTGGVVFCRRLR